MKLHWLCAFRAAPVSLAFLIGARARAADLSPKVHDLIGRFFDSPDFTNLQLSPAGTHVLVEKDIEGRQQLITVNLQTGVRASTTSNPGEDLEDARWVGGNQIIFELIDDVKAAERNGGETNATRLTHTVISHVYDGHYIVDAALKKIDLVPTRERIMEVIDPMPNNPHRVLMIEQQADNFYSPLYCFDPTTRDTRLLEKNGRHIVGWMADAAGQVRLAEVAIEHGRNSSLYRENEHSPWGALVLSEDSTPITFDPSGWYLLFSHPDAAGRMVVQSLDLRTKTLDQQTWSDPIYDVDPTLLRNPRTGEAQALAYSTDRTRFVWLDRELERLSTSLSAAFPGAEVYPVGPIANGDVLISVSADVSPRRYFILSRQKGQIGLFLDPHPRLRSVAMAPMKSVTFPAKDGTTIYGYLTLPTGFNGSKPPPLIALSHGGPFVRDVWGFDDEVQYFASLGYAVLQVNYRGSAGYGKAYALSDLIEVGHQSVDDVANGIMWAIAKGYADPKRIVADGGSYGGYISVALAERYPELPCCTIGFAGVYDWELMMKADRDDFRELVHWNDNYYPDLDKNRERYAAISPVHGAEKVRGPVLLIHGRDDRRVKVDQSELMARALKKAGKAVDLVRDLEGVHGFARARLRKEFYEHVTAFLFQNAPPDIVP